MKNNKWLEVEHTIRYLLCEKGILTNKDYFEADSLKSAIIALFGIKYLDDNNEIFKANMLREAYDGLNYFEERYPNHAYKLQSIREFIEENFEVTTNI